MHALFTIFFDNASHEREPVSFVCTKVEVMPNRQILAGYTPAVECIFMLPSTPMYTAYRGIMLSALNILPFTR